MRAIPTILAAVFCGLLLAAAAFMARADVVHDRAETAPPSPAEVAGAFRAAQNPKLTRIERTHLQMKARSAAHAAATEQDHSQDPALLDTLRAMPVFLLIPLIAGVPFVSGVAAVRAGRGKAAIGLSLISVVILAGCYLVIGGWWAAVNEESPPNYSPPGEQDVSIAVLLYGGAVLIALVIFPLCVRITRRHP